VGIAPVGSQGGSSGGFAKGGGMVVGRKGLMNHTPKAVMDRVVHK